ncbi:MAG: hypothetical protein KGO02_24095, partial [Alphaproteobacteria bacterium]|nr:hypothetical protein [Alphaproteobacteria bacterium]
MDQRAHLIVNLPGLPFAREGLSHDDHDQLFLTVDPETGIGRTRPGIFARRASDARRLGIPDHNPAIPMPPPSLTVRPASPV